MAEQQLDLREIPPPKRHPKIFEAFDELDGGEALTIVNDHEPTPLYLDTARESRPSREGRAFRRSVGTED
jgi:uncharacterized protein (DUF2249 family)